MKPRPWIVGFLLLVVIVDLLPIWLVVKQALSADIETFAWPPTWIPRQTTWEHVAAVGSDPQLMTALGRSAGVALAALLLTLTLSLPAAWVAARRGRLALRIDRALVLTRVLPSLALAVPLASLFIRLGLYNHPLAVGLCLAHTAIALPIAFLILHAAFREIPPDLKEAAWLEGARPWRVFWHISLPAVRPALAAVAVVVFLLSWDDLTFALLLQVTNRTLPPLVYYFVTYGYPGMASALALLLLLPALALMLVLEPAFRSGSFAGSGR